MQENAFNILHDQGWQAPADMSVRMRGAAVGSDEANQAMNGINVINDSDHRSYFAHPNDPVNVFVGGEKGNTGAAWTEWWRVFTTPNSAHSCYGTGAPGCTKVEAPFSYKDLGMTPQELNAIREQRKQNP